MSKKDLFVIMYCCIWASGAMILTTVNYFAWRFIDPELLTIIINMVFLMLTSSFVLIKPVRRWVDKNIIEKLP